LAIKAHRGAGKTRCVNNKLEVIGGASSRVSRAGRPISRGNGLPGGRAAVKRSSPSYASASGYGGESKRSTSAINRLLHCVLKRGASRVIFEIVIENGHVDRAIGHRLGMRCKHPGRAHRHHHSNAEDATSPERCAWSVSARVWKRAGCVAPGESCFHEIEIPSAIRGKTAARQRPNAATFCWHFIQACRTRVMRLSSDDLAHCPQLPGQKMR
jgi:hypothetical protein